MKPNAERREILLDSLHTLALFGMAVAQPLYDILGRFPEFLAVRGLSPMEILFLAVLLSLAAPGLLILAHWSARYWSPVLYRVLHRLTLGILAAALLLQLAKTLPLGGALLVALALAAAALLTGVYATRRGVRGFFHLLTPAAILFPLLFLFFSPVRELLRTDREPAERWEVGTSTPIIMVVFDEFPTISLLDENQEIDEVLFPNFARLAGEAYWFRNATTVNDFTLISVSSILTGLRPDIDRPRLPILRDHPRNLFTLFQSSHDLHVRETLTRLVPLSDNRETQGFFRTQSILLSDLSLVYLHLLLPSDLSAGLPRVTETWTDFRGHWRELAAPEPTEIAEEEPPSDWGDFRADWSLRAERFREFIASVQPSDRPPLYYFHTLLPHARWEHLPDGRRYRFFSARGVLGVVGPNDRGEDPNRWREDDWLVTQAHQAHLLQVQFVDQLVGELVQALRERDLYDRSLLVLTADHGAGFQAGDSRRAVTPTNHPEILSVPLFIKAPFQERGVIDDSNVEGIDILPTIVEVLGSPPPWPMDGRTAINRREPERPKKVVFTTRRERIEFDGSLPERAQFARRKTELFGSRRPEAIFSVGPESQLLGRNLDQLPVVDVPADRFEVRLEGEVFFRQVRTEGPFIPAAVTGRILTAARGETPRHLAVSVNGTIRAVTRTSEFQENHQAFTAVVPPESFREGDNRIDVLLVSELDGRLELLRAARPDVGFTLEQTPTGEAFLIGDRGDRFPVLPDEIAGWTTAGLNPSGDRMFVGGWAVDRRNLRPVRSVLVMLDGRSIAEGSTSVARRDAVEMFDAPDLLNSGFHFEFPPSALDPPQRAKVRVIAVSESGVAGELHYPAERSSWPFRRPRRGPPAAVSYQCGTLLEFGREGNALPHLVAGWGRPEDGIHWTVADEATFELRPPPPSDDIVLEVSLLPFLVPGKLDGQRVQLQVDGRTVGEWLLEDPRFQTATLRLSRDLFEGDEDVLIGLLTPDAASPVGLGVSPDGRSLGVAVRSLTFRTADVPHAP